MQEQHKNSISSKWFNRWQHWGWICAVYATNDWTTTSQLVSIRNL